MEQQIQVVCLNEGDYFKYKGAEYMVVLHFDSEGTARCMMKGGGMHTLNHYTWVTPTQGETV